MFVVAGMFVVASVLAVTRMFALGDSLFVAMLFRRQVRAAGSLPVGISVTMGGVPALNDSAACFGVLRVARLVFFHPGLPA